MFTFFGRIHQSLTSKSKVKADAYKYWSASYIHCDWVPGEIGRIMSEGSWLQFGLSCSEVKVTPVQCWQGIYVMLIQFARWQVLLPD